MREQRYHTEISPQPEIRAQRARNHLSQRGVGGSELARALVAGLARVQANRCASSHNAGPKSGDIGYGEWWQGLGENPGWKPRLRKVGGTEWLRKVGGTE
ncbi:hypothetical protein SAMN06265222_12213 [Neorhodopirellula lusitana]|uniref:Uncharacterized protein n=1 Tax=Neorhodopirellula lusitana TaxID=445327 RepID=A0ABY1QRJ5_9BACT|nr:hypothetical protein SAMN06265222_12213 [Neorhodopirellula lusitana]